MISFEKLVPIVEKRLGPSKRFEHTLMVVKTATQLAELHGADIEKVKIAAILHDITKHDSYESHQALIESFYGTNEHKKWPEQLWHALSAKALAVKEFKIDDPDILNAIQYHTSGRESMSLIEKIIFVADFIEPSRTFDNLIYYDTAMHNLNKALAMILYSLNQHLISLGETPVKDGQRALRFYQHHLEE
jgi:predicted HD superfamily hydrolase involved in NAD metabolism